MATSIPIEQFQAEMNRANQVLHEVFKEGDRAAAVLVGAELDRLLLAFLENYLLPKAEGSSAFLELNGPLETFSSRIELAYRIGLIPPGMHHDLHLLRKIRNEFAHGPLGLDFTQPPVNDFAYKLLMGRHRMAEMSSQRVKMGHTPLSQPRALDLFRLTASELVGRFTLLQYQVQKINAIWPRFFSSSEPPTERAHGAGGAKESEGV